MASVLNGEKPQNPPQGVDFLKIYELAKAHSVTEILSFAVEQLDGKPSDEFCEKMRKEQMAGIMKEVYQDNTLSQFSELCTEAKIPHMPLKGSVIKHLYPHPYLRSMCDMDILVKENDLSRAGKLLEKLGLEYEHSGTHDRLYRKAPFVCIEPWHGVPSTDGVVDDFENKQNFIKLAPSKNYQNYLAIKIIEN